MQLTKAEEKIMQYLWKLEKAFMKDILESFPDPKPANTTVATLLKRMIAKEAIGFQQFGNSREYFPKITKSDYYTNHLNSLIKESFDDSKAQFASFFASETGMSITELKELQKIIDEQIKRKDK